MLSTFAAILVLSLSVIAVLRQLVKDFKSEASSCGVCPMRERCQDAPDSSE